MSALKKTKIRPAGGSTSQLPEPMGQCLQLLRNLMTRTEAAPFIDPVDWQSLGLIDYPQIIKQPMDLSTIQNNLESNKYVSPSHFAQDMRLVWRNAVRYNRPDSEIYVTADYFRELFEKKYAKILRHYRKRAHHETGGLAPPSTDDLHRLTQLCTALTDDELNLIIELVNEQCPEAIIDEGEDNIEIDLVLLEPQTLFSLITFAEFQLHKRNQSRGLHEIQP